MRVDAPPPTAAKNTVSESHPSLRRVSSSLPDVLFDSVHYVLPAWVEAANLIAFINAQLI
jgi:hypothetical protein